MPFFTVHWSESITCWQNKVWRHRSIFTSYSFSVSISALGWFSVYLARERVGHSAAPRFIFSSSINYQPILNKEGTQIECFFMCTLRDYSVISMPIQFLIGVYFSSVVFKFKKIFWSLKVLNHCFGGNSPQLCGHLNLTNSDISGPISLIIFFC